MVFEPPFTALVTTITRSLAQCSGLGSFMHTPPEPCRSSRRQLELVLTMHAAHPLHQSSVRAHVVNSNLSLPSTPTHSSANFPCNSKHSLHDLHPTHARDAGYDPSIQAPGLFATGARMQACTRTRAGTRARDGQGQGGDAHAPRTSTCTVVGALTLAVASSVAICKYILLVEPSTCVASLTLALH
jgi:hypothetical protein